MLILYEIQQKGFDKVKEQGNRKTCKENNSISAMERRKRIIVSQLWREEIRITFSVISFPWKCQTFT